MSTLGDLPQAARDDGTPPATKEGPIVVLNWSPEAYGLVEALAAAAPRADGPAVFCVGSLPSAQVTDALPIDASAKMRYVEAPTASDDVVELARALEAEVGVAHARSVIVRPDRASQEPDANSRVTCVAVVRACGGRPIPNILVEVQDPEAAYEFAGLGVATVFYPGYLRAALLAHACVDLGVFQFVYGLLRGTYRVRLMPLPEVLETMTFLDAVDQLEEDEQGRPITLIGVHLRRKAGAEPTPSGHLVINPGPRHPLSDALGLLALEER